MLRPFVLLLLVLLPGLAGAEPFQPPIPAPQTAAAELSYAIASVLMIVMLAAAGWLARRR